MVTKLLIFVSPFSLFSAKLLGFEFYLTYMLFPGGLILFVLNATRGLKLLQRRGAGGRGRRLDPKVLSLMLLLTIIVFGVFSKPFLFTDILKVIVMFVVFYNIRSFAKANYLEFEKVLDLSICCLVIYGLFQYSAVVLGHEDLAARLHHLIGFEGHGGPIDRRGGILRVASLTKEPSYFAYVVGVYIFIARHTIMKMVCLVGLAISFSLITVYAMSGVLIYRILKAMGVGFLGAGLMVLAAHWVFVGFFFDSVPVLVKPSFDERYAAFTELAERGRSSEFLFGSFSVDEEAPTNLVRPLSNIGSILFLFGLVGYSSYLYLFTTLEKRSVCPAAVASMFLYGFNFYYLTAWPIIIVYFAFVAMEKQKTGNRSATRYASA